MLRRMDFPLPLRVDLIDNSAMTAYAAWPERLYIIDEAGGIAYKGGNGPIFFEPDEVEEWLEERFTR